MHKEAENLNEGFKSLKRLGNAAQLITLVRERKKNWAAVKALPTDYFSEKAWAVATQLITLLKKYGLLLQPNCWAVQLLGSGSSTVPYPSDFGDGPALFGFLGQAGAHRVLTLLKKTCKQKKNNGGQPVERMVASKLLLFVFDVDHSGNEVVKGSKTQL